MTETKIYTNPLVQCDTEAVEDNHYHTVNGVHYHSAEWDMTVTLTRKIKPLGHGALITNGSELFQKIRGEWYYLVIGDKYDVWDPYKDLTDETVRNDIDTYTVLLEGVI